MPNTLDDTDEEESTTVDVTGTVEPYLYEPEVSDYEGTFTSDSSDEEDGDDSSDEGMSKVFRYLILENLSIR